MKIWFKFKYKFKKNYYKNINIKTERKIERYILLKNFTLMPITNQLNTLN